MRAEPFGTTPQGETVHRVELRGGGLRAAVLTWGAVLQDLRLDGHAPPLVLGFADFAPYPAESPYFGATVARVANRIRDGHAEIGGRHCQLDRNEHGRHHLHGGAGGAGRRVWKLRWQEPDAVCLSILLEDGEMGYPGRLALSVTIALTAGATLALRYEAQTDSPTLCAPAHHSYFTLDDSGHILDHRLRVAARFYLPVDDELIPTGEVAPVAGTGFDFRQARPVGEGAALRGRLDHNFCLSRARRGLRPVAWLDSPRSGLAMEVATTEPGLQVYDGASVAVASPGLDGRPIGAHAGLALEPQNWPDANHHASFPQAALRPGETYRQESRFRFRRSG